MRFRTKSKVLDQVNGSITWLNGTSSPPITYFSEDSRKLADIYDELLPKSDFRTRHCHHIRGTERHIPCSFEEHDPHQPTWGNHVYDNVPIVGYMDFAGKDTSWTVSSQIASSLAKRCDDENSSFNSRAYQTMLPSLEGDVSLTNFVLELGDFKQILRLFAPSRDISKKISEGHLTWSFAIKPMISDLTEIWNTLHNYEKRIREFLERSKTPQKRYYHESDEATEEEDEILVYSGYGMERKTRVFTKTKIDRYATMSYNYDVEPIKTRLQTLNALRGMLGLKFTPSVVWEAIPFSFVVDWFLNVGQWLESLESDVIQPDVVVTDYSVTYKVSYAVRAIFDCPGLLSFSQTCYNSYYSEYRRRRCLPDTGSTPLQFSGATPNQLALSASLINVMRR